MTARSLSLMGRLFAPALAGLAVLAAAPAQAGGDVYWSVGVQSPGIGATFSNAPPVVHVPAPVVVYPAPVYVVPSHPHKFKHGHKHRHHHHHGEWRHGGRWDD